jgi:Ca2+-binding EF-hand superfamily protein
MNRLLVEKIDTNNDGFVELEELNQWIKNVTHKNIMKEVERRWQTLENNNSLEAYIEFNYASLKLCKNRLAFN